jgi:S-adenosylmethionine decarboxylase
MSQRTETFGVHVMIDGYGANAALLADRVHLQSVLDRFPAEFGMHPISTPQLVEVGPMNPKDSGGLSGFVMIAESHLSFHTFPSRGFVTMDFYTCQSGLDRDTAIQRLTSAFGLEDADVFVQERGLRYPAEDVVFDARAIDEPQLGGTFAFSIS